MSDTITYQYKSEPAVFNQILRCRENLAQTLGQPVQTGIHYHAVAVDVQTLVRPVVYRLRKAICIHSVGQMIGPTIGETLSNIIDDAPRLTGYKPRSPVAK